MLPATAAHAASFSTIDVRGNLRVEASTIRDYVGIKPGQSYSASDLDEAIKRLYSTGLFSDVSISQSGGTLVITVSENQVINQVSFTGNKKIKDASLSGQVQLKSGNVARQQYARTGCGDDPRSLSPHRPRRCCRHPDDD